MVPGRIVSKAATIPSRMRGRGNEKRRDTKFSKKNTKLPSVSKKTRLKMLFRSKTAIQDDKNSNFYKKKSISISVF